MYYTHSAILDFSFLRLILGILGIRILASHRHLHLFPMHTNSNLSEYVV